MSRHAGTFPFSRPLSRFARTARVARVPAICLLIAALLLSGCSAFVPRLQAPHLSVINVTLLRSDLWHQELKVRMRVQNPNDRRLPVKGLTYVLDVDGQELAHGQSDAGFVVPPLGEADFDMSVSANMAGLVVRLLGQGATPMEYHLTGRISLSQGLLRDIPFDERGSFRLN
ncbi:MAG TPA: LEA type 2 family protein [Steroidobacteraceae bacterium]|nr:LEA type 2 family protein [Steroidobacteraceae bacterium]